MSTMSSLLHRGRRCRPGPWWRRRDQQSVLLPVLCRGVTDIDYYREVDQSHLHLKEAQSTMRKFQIKLQKLQEEEESKSKRRMKRNQEEQEEATQLEEEAGDEEIVIPNYIERGPSELLRLISSNVGRDYTAADYRYHDDPFLIPYNSTSKRDYAFAKAGGRNAARFVIERHPDLFEKNQIEADPPIEAFMPKVKFGKRKANEQLLWVYLEGESVENAVKTYEAIGEKGDTVSDEAKQALLELLAFHNHERPKLQDELDLETRGMLFVSKDAMKEEKWETGCLAEKLYSDLDTTAARAALLCGMARHHQFHRGWQVYKECVANNDRLDTNVYNHVFRCVPKPAPGGGLEKEWSTVVDVLKAMRRDGCRPNASTLIEVLGYLQRCRSADRKFANKMSLATLAEFKKNCGVEPSLGAYYVLIELFGRQSRVILDILTEVEHKSWPEVRDEFDTRFLKTAMNCAHAQGDLALAYRVYDMMTRNEVLMNDFGEETTFYRFFLDIVLEHESFEVAAETVDKLTPHLFSPTYQFRVDMLDKIGKAGAYNYLPKFWSDLQLSKFSSVRKMQRLELTRQVLDTVWRYEEQDGASSNNLQATFLQICRDGLRDVMDRPDDDRCHLSQNTEAAPICDLVVRIALRYDDVATASEAIEFCRGKLATIPGSLREDTISTFAAAMIEKRDKKAALDCVVYTMEMGMETGEQIAIDVTKAFALSDDEKQSLNKMFAHDTRWKALS